MKAHDAHRGAPDVDGGDARDLAALLRRELRPTPGRLGDSVRIVVVVLAVVAILETFRIPEIAVSAYIVLFLSGREAASTVRTALAAGIAVVLAIFTAIGVFMLSLSEPALRIPLMAVMTFGAMFLARAATLGPVFFVAGFVIAYGLTLGDEVLGLALQPATVGNASQFELPEIFFIPPEDALVRFLLWFSLAVVVPVVLLIAANLLTGRDPALLLRRALTERLATATRFCAGKSGADHVLEAQAFEGTAQLRKLYDLAGFLRRGKRRPVWSPSLITDIAQLGLLLLSWLRVEGDARDALLPASSACCEAERALQNGEAPSAEPVTITATGAARPLADAISRRLRAIRETLAGPAAERGAHDVTEAPRQLLAADAFSNPDYVRFALKVTLAVMVCYFVMSMTDWPGIHTCVITCFFVALGTVGDTLHKVTLRFVGCLIGAGLGLGAILLLMPLMTELGDLLLLLAPVTLLAAWIGYGSERVAYAGLQIGLAFYLVVLQGYGPTIDMYTARDRTIGILFGNIVIFVIFTTIWPVSVANVVRTNLARALEQLAVLVGLGARADVEISQAARSAAETAFGQAIGQARAVLVNDPFETREVRHAVGRRSIDATVVEQVGRLFIPVSAILDLCADPAGLDLPQPTHDALRVYNQALAAWFRQAASWTRSGERADAVSAGLPEPPAISGPGDHLTALATWYRLLHEDIRKILDEVGPQPQPVIAPSVGDALHVVG
ncbi:MAG TPA: FUSC family protein [Stellaceae bacterium]